MTNVVLYGGTGLATMLRETIGFVGDKIIAIIDDTPNLLPPYPNAPVFYGWQSFKDSTLYKDRESYGFMIAIGNPGKGKKPMLFSKLEGEGLKPYTVIHSTSFVADDSIIGEGSFIDAGAILMARSVIGKSCIIGPNSNISHDSTLGDFVDTTVGVTVCGNTTIGNNVLLGGGSVVLPRLKIGDNVIVGAGSVVTKDIPNDTIVIGVPARKYVKKNDC